MACSPGLTPWAKVYRPLRGLGDCEDRLFPRAGALGQDLSPWARICRPLRGLEHWIVVIMRKKILFLSSCAF